MRTIQLAFIALAASMALGSCENSEPSVVEESADLIRIDAVHPSASSRATETGFESGDRIGLYVVDASSSLQPGGNMINNGCFEYNGASWNALSKYYWNKGTYNVYAYYPYTKRVEDTESYSFELAKDQSTDEGCSSADFLWAKAEGQSASASPVSLKFSHCLSNVEVMLTKASDYEGENRLMRRYSSMVLTLLHASIFPMEE